MDDVARILLVAGELVHIGKNTSFGFGRYTLVEGGTSRFLKENGPVTFAD